MTVVRIGIMLYSHPQKGSYEVSDLIGNSVMKFLLLTQLLNSTHLSSPFRETGGLSFSNIFIQFSKSVRVLVIGFFKKLFGFFCVDNRRSCQHFWWLPCRCEQSCHFSFYAIHNNDPAYR